MKTIWCTTALFLSVVSLSVALPSVEPIPKPAQPIDKAIELARQEMGRTYSDVSEYLLMMAVYARPLDYARKLNEWERKQVKSLPDNEYSWFIELRHPVSNDRSATLRVRRDGSVETLWQTE